MDMPSSTDVTVPPALGRVIRAIAKLEASTQLAIVCVVFGWFFMNTLVVSLGSLQHGVPFFDMSAVIADPMRLFFGVEWSFQRVVFALICLGSLVAVVAPQLLGRHARFAYLGPLALMLVCGVALYARTSGEFFAQPLDTTTLSSSVIHFANDLVRKGSGVVSRHIAIGAGGYLAFIGSAVLAVQGARRIRRGA